MAILSAVYTAKQMGDKSEDNIFEYKEGLVMKRWMAAALSTAMVMGAFPIASMAEETISDELEFVLTAEGESLTAVITEEYGADGTASFSGSITFPAAMMGEEMTFALEDLVRVSGGDVYLNADAAIDLYYNLTGDTSMTMLATMVGIDQPWIKIPALDWSSLEVTESTESSAVSEALMAELYNCIAPFEMTETENGIEIVFDGADIGVSYESLVNILKNYTDELAGLTSNTGSVSFDYKAVFGDYILAAAEGINTVDPGMSVEDGVDMICEMIDAVIAESVTETEIVVSEDSFADLDEMVAEMKETLTAENFTGRIVINDSGVNCDLTVLEDGAVQGVVNANATIAEDGLTFGISAIEEEETTEILKGSVLVTEEGFEAEAVAYDNDETAGFALSAAAIENGFKFAFSVSENEEKMELLNGTVTADDAGFSLECTVSDGSDEFLFALNGTSVTEGTYAEISAPENATLLRDVVKNVVIIYGSMMMMEEGAVTE